MKLAITIAGLLGWVVERIYLRLLPDRALWWHNVHHPATIAYNAEFNRTHPRG